MAKQRRSAAKANSSSIISDVATVTCDSGLWAMAPQEFLGFMASLQQACPILPVVSTQFAAQFVAPKFSLKKLFERRNTRNTRKNQTFHPKVTRFRVFRVFRGCLCFLYWRGLWTSIFLVA
jgi:hypothetical protein